ncbi:hypothetical protein ACFV0R_06200 [Streptomyces sp. NPDC059578]|uniref:hypothetical protein n=1 Tax=unclassified Streptomyces TaxID=2593676 RepID=UPI003650C5A1
MSTVSRPPTGAPVTEPLAVPPLPPPGSLTRRVLGHPRLIPHHRLLASVLLVNAGVLGYAVAAPGPVAVDTLSHAALVNFTLAVLIRQQYVINALFRIATAAPLTWPLRVRWALSKVYHFGGLHIGGAVAGTLWFLALTVRLTHDGAPLATLLVSWAPAVVLTVVALTALPALRARFHDAFERVHRFGGWAALALLWAQTLLVAHDRGTSLVASPGPWLLALVTFSIALPWLRLRRVPVALERPSSHVVLAHFDHGVTPFAGSATAISRSPLTEWHSFANVPAPGRSGFRLTVSRAGDWTGEFIDELPDTVWVKGIPTAGVANIETLFRRVVYIATGSGIGPCLPHLLAGTVPARLVWAARSPRATYGDALVDEILAAQPDAVVWDTATHGKPDMAALAHAVWQESGAEAVICISNRRLTRAVVHALEQRGIPAHGAIWDS